MEKVIVEYNNGNVTTYDVVLWRTYKKGKKEVLEQNIPDLINHPSVVEYKIVEPKRSKGNGESLSTKYESKNIKEDIPMPMKIADEIVMFARGDGKGFTKEVVEKWNKHFDFDLH